MMKIIFIFLLLSNIASSYLCFNKHSHHIQFHKRDFDKSKYPAPDKSPDRSTLPQDWIDALQSLERSGKIPNIPPTVDADTGIQYPNGIKGDSKEVCNWSINNCFGENDIRNASDGIWTISFDDGPTYESTSLYDYLHENQQPGTHFMIGSQILRYPEIAKHAIQTQQQLAVHTWSHQLQTTKTNMEILGDLGWNIQIIYDLTGRVAKYWRPPQGNADNRVRAIAEQVFNLSTIMWNNDCNDWCIGTKGESYCPNDHPGNSEQSVINYIQKTLQRPKQPGVILLEHELNNKTIGFFKNHFPSLKGLGWTTKSIPDALGMNWYSNAVNNDDKPIPTNSILYTTVKDAVLKANSTSTKSPSNSPLPSNSTSPLSKSQSVKNSASTLRSYGTLISGLDLAIAIIILTFVPF